MPFKESSPLPNELRQLARDCALPRRAEREAFEKGDLESGARAYAHCGEYNGKDGNWWRVWWQIQLARGKSAADAVEELSSQGRRWFAAWSFERGDNDNGILSYARYLQSPGKIGPFSRETSLYLTRLNQSGKLSDAVRQVDALYERSDDLPKEELTLCRLLVKAGDVQQARRRFLQVRERHHDWGEAWAMSALLSAAASDLETANVELAEAAKLGVDDEALVEDALDALGKPEAEWNRMREPWRLPSFDFERQRNEWASEPGFLIQPSKTKTPHVYGGNSYQMPPCRGCGRLIREWFTLDLREIPRLGAQFSPWTRFPLLCCADCAVWLARHDYEVDLDSMRIELVNVADSTKSPVIVFRQRPHVPRQ